MKLATSPVSGGDPDVTTPHVGRQASPEGPAKPEGKRPWESVGYLLKGAANGVWFGMMVASGCRSRELRRYRKNRYANRRTRPEARP